ncbi:hypothetical protein AU198_19250 [Mycobacterium sp. GA-1199]|uniref:hypothetical protein n=1 Tax=Mycobacterium sp. GA-1199 TaxID=1772287 RepID=UPI000748B639|nr:hypothetical protein [Mycobacterium sp. GA-1199]KUI48162.1 hypothetical protein AU198_19250 [Mycobacterium sp. GA-1199]
MSNTTPDPATVGETDDALDDGRPVVLEPTPPGLWRALLGTAVAVLAPLFGFLVGGIFGAGTTGDSVDPMFLSLFAGIVIGGVGVLVALSGGARLWRHFHRQDALQETEGI